MRSSAKQARVRFGAGGLLWGVEYFVHRQDSIPNFFYTVLYANGKHVAILLQVRLLIIDFTNILYLPLRGP